MAMYYLEHYGFVGEEPYLAHYGIKGMKWRHRRPSIYQHRRDQMKRYAYDSNGARYKEADIGPHNGTTHRKRSESDQELVDRINRQTYGNTSNDSNAARLMRMARVRNRQDELAKKGIYQDYASVGGSSRAETLRTTMLMPRTNRVTSSRIDRDYRGNVTNEARSRAWERMKNHARSQRRRKPLGSRV